MVCEERGWWEERGWCVRSEGNVCEESVVCVRREGSVCEERVAQSTGTLQSQTLQKAVQEGTQAGHTRQDLSHCLTCFWSILKKTL